MEAKTAVNTWITAVSIFPAGMLRDSPAAKAVILRSEIFELRSCLKVLLQPGRPLALPFVNLLWIVRIAIEPLRSLKRRRLRGIVSFHEGVAQELCFGCDVLEDFTVEVSNLLLGRFQFFKCWH